MKQIHRMKTCGVAAQRSEDCGVWLDTVQLKGKVQKKRSARPISKLLNPFTAGAGYNVAVALNFTQTKIEMPKTKQSSISNFFTGQRRVLNKMCTPGSPSAEAQEPSPSTRPRGDSHCDTEPLLPDVDYEQDGNAKFTKPEAAMWWEKEQYNSLLKVQGDCKEESSVEICHSPCKSILPSSPCYIEQKSSKGSLHSNHESESNFLSSLPSQSGFNAFEGFFKDEGRTSTQKIFKGQNDKENTITKSPKIALSDLRMSSKHAELETFQNHSSQLKDLNSIKWTKPKTSPIKKPKSQCRGSDEETLSMLFTQDSQGFRVIAHRGLHTRSPLKDQSNISTRSPVKCSEEDEDEEEMLFTQDSQGNIVIKH